MPSCKHCKTKGAQLKINLHSFCNFDCAVSYGKDAAKKAQDKARAKKQAEARRLDREKKESFKMRSEWLKEAQAVFNKYIRIRDAQKNCISCGGALGNKYDAGHYKSCGAHPELRFNEWNTNAQCVRCNQHLSGNLINYRKGLLARIGAEKVEWLEGCHEPLKLTIDEIKALKAEYSKKCRELEKAKLV